MKKAAMLMLSIASATILFAQPNKKMADDALASKKMEADTAKKGAWKKGGIIAINLNQQTSSYWIGATEKYSLNLGASADLYANMARKKNTWDNTLKLNYAFQNTQSQGERK